MASSEAAQDTGAGPILLSARPLRTRLGPRGGIVTREAVFEAAEELDAQIGRATLQGIRAKLGGGSMTPIAEHFRAYRAAKLKAASASPEELLTASLREAFVVAIANAQNEARKACAAELEEREMQCQELAEAVAELEAERERLQDQVDELQVAMAEFREQAAAREAQRREDERESAGKLAALIQDRDEARRETHDLRAKVAVLEAANKQTNAYADIRDTERKSAVEALESERRARVKADQSVAVADANAASCAAALKRLESDLIRERQETTKLRDDLQQIHEALRLEQQDAQKLAVQSATLTAQLERERNRAAAAEEAALRAARSNDAKSRSQHKTREARQ